MSTTYEQPIAASKMDKATIYAIAKTALREYDDGGGFDRPQSNAYVALDFGVLAAQHPEKDGTCNGAAEAFDLAFEFALQLGARIAADPMRVPPVQDLIEEYRFKKAAPTS